MTVKQKRAADNLVGNGGNVTQAMRDAGYSENTLNSPQKLTQSKGFREIADSLGLTDSFIVKALQEDIENKPGQRAKELALAIKVKGLEQNAAPQVNIVMPIYGGQSVRRENPSIPGYYSDSKDIPTQPTN